MDDSGSSSSFGSSTDECSSDTSASSAYSMSTDTEALGYESGTSTESEYQSDDGDDGSNDDDDDDNASVAGFEAYPLYEGADLTVLDSNILLLQYALRNGLTQKAFSELLAIVAACNCSCTLILPSSAYVSRTVYKLKGFFTNRFPDVSAAQEYMYCSVCHQLLEETNRCTNGCSAKMLRFLLVPVASQLRRMLEGLRPVMVAVLF